MNNAFAELRSLLNQSNWDFANRKKLWGLARAVKRSYPEQFESYWLAYMAGFAHHWEGESFATVKGGSAAARVLDVLPFVSLDVSLTYKDLHTSNWSEQPWFEHVTGIHIGARGMHNEDISRITRDLCPPRLTALNIHASNLNDVGIGMLLDWIDPARLEVLNLRSSHRMSEASVRHMLRLGPWRRLRLLDIMYCHMSFEAHHDLLRMGAPRSPEEPPLALCVDHVYRMEDAPEHIDLRFTQKESDALMRELMPSFYSPDFR